MTEIKIKKKKRCVYVALNYFLIQVYFDLYIQKLRLTFQ